MKIILLILTILLISPIVSALDTHLPVGCGGDDELIIGCLGDDELVHLGIGPLIESKSSIDGKGPTHTTTLKEEISIYEKLKEIPGNLLIYLVGGFILICIILKYVERKKEYEKREKETYRGVKK